MQIRIADNKLGECVITSNTKLEKREEYAIKSLCMMQLMCMNSAKRGDPKFGMFIKILREAMEKAEALYKDEQEELDGDPFEQFN